MEQREKKWKSLGLSYFLMKCIQDAKHSEVYCGMVDLTDDHQANEGTDGHQYFVNVSGGCENRLRRWQTVTPSRAPLSQHKMHAQTISSARCKIISYYKESLR